MALRANSSKLPAKVFKKAAHMQREGVPRKQAIATAAGMMRAGRLTAKGEYRRVT